MFATVFIDFNELLTRIYGLLFKYVQYLLFNRFSFIEIPHFSPTKLLNPNKTTLVWYFWCVFVG